MFTPGGTAQAFWGRLHHELAFKRQTSSDRVRTYHTKTTASSATKSTLTDNQGNKMAKKDIQSDSVEAFVLRDCGFGMAGDVVTLTSADAETGKAHGMLDLEPAAIAHAKGEQQ